MVLRSFGHFRSFPLEPGGREAYPSSILALRTRSHALKKLLQLLLVTLGCLHLAGGPYALMQVYAWAGMLVSYSKDDGLLKAAKDTFSGEKPCELCSKISAAKKEAPDAGKKEAPAPSAASGKLLQEIIATADITLEAPRFTDSPAITFPGFLLSVETRGVSPPVPPPRGLA